MKHSPALFFLYFCGLILATTVTSPGLSISPPHIDVIAGDTGVFWISGLPTDTNYAPAQVYLTSFDPDRLAVISPSPLSQLTSEIEVWIGPDPEDTKMETVYHPDLPVHFAARHRMEGLFDPIPVSGYVVRRNLHNDTVQHLGYVEAAVSVVDPMLALHPGALAVQTPNVRPVVLQRSIHAFASLTVTLRSDIEHVLGLGAIADPNTHGDSLELTFDTFEVNKVFYISGRAMAEDTDSITGALSARVGSYLYEQPITVTRHPSLILQPVPYSGLGTNRTAEIHAGDAFNLLVRRTSEDDKLVSDYEVTLSSDLSSVARVPESVVIPAGARQVAFTVSGRKPGETVIRATGPNAETVAESAFAVVVVEPQLDYAPAAMSIDEGETALLTISRLNTFSGADLIIDIESMAPTLFQPVSGELVIPAGAVSGSVGIQALAEGSNYLSVAVGSYRTNIPVRVAAATPGVRVFLEPSVAGTAGAAWRVDGGPWRSSGVLAPLDPGVYEVEFSAADGWIAPTNREVIVFEEKTTSLTATYIRAAGLRIHLQPPEAIADGARWRIAGGDWRESGQLVQRPPGVYQVEYRDLGDRWKTPPSHMALIESETIVEETTTYQFASGVLVELAPAGAVSDGARWRIKDGDWYQHGDFVPADPGEHTIEFLDITGWLAPPVRTVTVLPEQAALLSVSYQSDDESGLIAYLMPPAAAAAGARWRIEGGDWQENGAFLPLDPGDYRVEFREVEGWLTPPWVNAEVGPDVATPLTAAYLDANVSHGLAVYLYPPAAVEDGGAWRIAGSEWQGSGSLLELDGQHDDLTVEFRAASGWLQPIPIIISESINGVVIYARTYYRGEIISAGRGDEAGWFNQPTGMAFDNSGRLIVADSRNHRLQRREADDTWTVIGGPGNGAGQFNEPFAVVVDDQDGYYVSEIGNNRIQHWDAGGNWTVLGAAGKGDGEFNGPFDLALDADGNLFVADLYNNRVQRRSAADGTWSVYIDPGQEDKAAWMPSGLTIWNSRLALADFMAPDNSSRVMLFDYPQLDGTLIGSSSPDEGNLKRLYGLAAGPGNRLLAAGSVNQRIVVYSDTDPVWRVLVGDILKDPRAAHWRNEGGVDYCYIADTGNHRILRVETVSNELTPAAAGAIPPRRDSLNLSIAYASGESATIMRTTSMLTSSAGNLVVRWPGQAGARYTLQYTEQPLDPSAWQTVPGAVLLRGHDGMMEYSVNSELETTRFYRIIGYPIQ